MSRPVLLLDLDGVLNPFAASSCPDGYLEHEFFPGEGPERYCPGHAAWITELAAAGDLHWATGWGAEANTLFGAKLGIAALPVVPFPPVPFPPEAISCDHPIPIDNGTIRRRADHIAADPPDAGIAGIASPPWRWPALAVLEICTTDSCRPDGLTRHLVQHLHWSGW